jgi:hypothetical protein
MLYRKAGIVPELPNGAEFYCFSDFLCIWYYGVQAMDNCFQRFIRIRSKKIIHIEKAGSLAEMDPFQRPARILLRLKISLAWQVSATAGKVVTMFPQHLFPSKGTSQY